ncbi:hypothetical protein BH09PSE6_BH09PSE6_00010 [soil metagenome]
MRTRQAMMVAMLSASAVLLTACNRGPEPGPAMAAPTTSGGGSATGITPTPSDSTDKSAPTMGMGSAPPNVGGESGTPGSAGPNQPQTGGPTAGGPHISEPSGGAEAATAKDSKSK